MKLTKTSLTNLQNTMTDCVKKDIFHSKPFFLILSPMEGVTNAPFRRLCKRYGADILITEFVSSDALSRNIEKSFQKISFSEQERPLGIQIFGSNESALVSAALKAQERNPDFIDINWGCPVKKVAGKGAGSGILNNIDRMVELTQAVVRATSLPVSVKTRLGYSEESKPIEEIALRLQDVGIKALSIHGRTRAQMYKGSADWTLIGKVKHNPQIHIPIFGNGDITSAQKALEMKETYGVDGILIGRATIGNPFIFKETKALLEGKPLPIIPLSERKEVCHQHLLSLIELLGERVAINEMRKNYPGYFKGLANFKPTRIKLLTSLELNEILDTIASIPEE